MRDHVRAAFVAFHLLVVVVLGLPQPGGFMHERLWRKPEVVGAIRTATRVVNAVGIGLSEDEVKDVAWGAGLAWQKARRRTVQHLTWYVDYCGVKQGWSMFASLPKRSARLEVQIEEDGVWRTVYRAQDPDADWRGRQLRQERVRAFVNNFAWKRHQRGFPVFADALAVRASGDFPEATRLRAHMVPVQLVAPAALRAAGALPEGAPYWQATVDLSAFR
jgi:hypothetical protein